MDKAVKVAAGSCISYDNQELKRFFQRSFEEIRRWPAGSKVLLKPNLLSGRSPEKAVNTDPRMIRVLAEMLKEDGCEVWVGDSPGFESTERALEKSGILQVMRQLGLNTATFDRQVIKEGCGISPYKQFLFGEDPRDYDVVINLPKLKTHTMMGLTGGVKNTFGFVPRLEKAKWHLRCGRNTKSFAAVLVDIHATIAPFLTILDGVVGMDGDGPMSGRPRDFGLIAVSESAFALDLFLEDVLHFPVSLPINEVIREKEILDGYELVDLGIPPISKVKMPKTVMNTQWNMKGCVGEALRNVFVRKPKQNAKQCTACGICVHVCPPKALSLMNGVLHFDYQKCIRCYCCQEMCPTGSIKV